MNKQKERLEECGDITFNLDYWDCECKKNFIHPIKLMRCPICQSEQEDSPSSRANEVALCIK